MHRGTISAKRDIGVVCMDSSMLTAQDAIMRLSAAELDYSVDQLAELARRSAISGAQEIAGAWYFPLADIDAFIYSRSDHKGERYSGLSCSALYLSMVSW
jgi:hypothetical protein